MKKNLKIFWKILLSIIIFLIILITMIKLFFPIYKVEPYYDSQNWMVIDAKYVVTLKYFDENNLKETDFIIYKNILDKNYLVFPYDKEFFKKYKNNAIWKIIYNIK